VDRESLDREQEHVDDDGRSGEREAEEGDGVPRLVGGHRRYGETRRERQVEEEAEGGQGHAGDLRPRAGRDARASARLAFAAELVDDVALAVVVEQEQEGDAGAQERKQDADRQSPPRVRAHDTSEGVGRI
jgi:hypothetical protein